MTATVNTAPCKWAQRSDTIYLTIALPDVKNSKIDLEESKLTFAGTSNDKQYEITLDFFKPLDKEGSKINVLERNVQMLLKKKDTEEEFWPRLLKDKLLEKGCVTIDWDRYVDEDEEDEAGAFDQSNLAGGMDMASMMGGMGGMGGMPGMGGMGGMGGMPGMGGMGGMPGMGGGGMGGMDMEALMKQMGDMKGGMPDMGDLGGDGEDSDDDDLPDLEVDKDAN